MDCKLLLKILIVVFSIGSGLHSVYAQLAGSWYKAANLNDNSGLPQNSIRSIFFSRQTSLLWLTTGGGLVRYDGVSTKTFGIEALPSLRSVRIFGLFRTTKNELIGCTPLGDLFAVHNNRPVDLKGKRFKNFHRQIDVFPRGNYHSLQAIDFDDDIPFDVSEGAGILQELWITDSLWINLTATHIRLMYGHKVLHKYTRQNPGTDGCFILRGNHIYVLNSQGRGSLIHLDGYHTELVLIKDELIRKKQVTFYYDQLNDQPFLLADSVLYEVKFNGSSLQLSNAAVLNDLPTAITSIVKHPSNNQIFVATNTTGLHVYKKTPFSVYKAKGDDALNNVYAAVMTDSSHILSSNAVLFDVRTGQYQKIPVSINYQQAIGLDRQNRVWTRQAERLIRFLPNSPFRLTSQYIGKNNYFSCACIADNGRLWIATRDFLGYEKDGKLLPRFYNRGKEDSLHFYFINKLFDGKLAGITLGGLYVIDTSYGRHTLLVSSKLTGGLRGMYSDADNKIWLNTYGNGMMMYDIKTKGLYRLPADDNGYLNYCHAFAEDGSGNFLLPSNKGLFRISHQNMLQACYQPGTPLHYEYYTAAEGLPTNEFNGGCMPAYNRLRNGDIIFPSLRGLVAVRINMLPKPEKAPIFIDAVETSKQVYENVNTDSTIGFGTEERFFSLYICVPQWQAAGPNIYYRLNNDSAWKRLPTGMRVIRLNDLNGGHQQLHIKYKYGTKEEECTTVQFPFFIAYKLYERWWFWPLLLAMLAGMVLLLAWLKSYQLKRKNKHLQAVVRQKTAELFSRNTELEQALSELKEAFGTIEGNSHFKTRLIGLIGHDMLTPLGYIAKVSAQLNTYKDRLSTSTREEAIEDINHTSVRLLYLAESLIHWVKLQEGRFELLLQYFNISQIAGELVDFHSVIVANKGNQLQNLVPEILECYNDPTVVKVILHNLLLNAGKFTANGQITIEGELLPDCIKLQVTDTGIGMDESIVAVLNKMLPVGSNYGTAMEKGYGMGFQIISDLLKEIDGHFFVQSAVGKGTTINIFLPYK